MGRSKSIPVQKKQRPPPPADNEGADHAVAKETNNGNNDVGSGDNVSSLLLGRQALLLLQQEQGANNNTKTTSSFSIHDHLAAQLICASDDDDDDDDQDEVDLNQEGNPLPRGVVRFHEEQRNETTGSSSSRLQQILNRVEQEQKEKQEKRNKKKRRCSAAKTAKKKKQVSFSNQTHVVIPPHPEIQIVDAEDGSTTATSGALRKEIRYCRYQEDPNTADAAAEEDPNMRLLRAYPFPADIPVVVVVPQEEAATPAFTSPDVQDKSNNRIIIRTFQGAIDVWKCVVAGSRTKDEDMDLVVALGRSVQAGTIQMEIVRSCLDHEKDHNQHPGRDDDGCGGYVLHLSVTQQGMECCNRVLFAKAASSSTRRLPPPTRRRSTNKMNNSLAVYYVHQVMALLFQDSEIADVYYHVNRRDKHKNTESSAAAVVTAKQVYGLTDNVQLKRALQSPTTKPLNSIPGLLPTLRPYQEKAVEWMLEREQQRKQQGQQQQVDDQEWQLAWLVLVESTGRAIPLPQWTKEKHHYDAQQKIGVVLDDVAVLEPVLLFNPFPGWFAESIPQAKTMSMIGNHRHHNDDGVPATTKGGSGILAETMGLGKSVELLACILANPCPSRRNNASSSTARRRLQFEETATTTVSKEEDKNKSRPAIVTDASTSSVSSSSKSTFGIVADTSEFGDAEDDDDDDDDSMDEAKPSPYSTRTPESSRLPTTAGTINDDAAALNPGVASAVPVTPEKDSASSLSVPVEERWTDEEVLGACICGELIGFSTKNGSGSVVFCQSCEEPMHMYCADFDTSVEMERETMPVRYRQRFTNKSLDVRVLGDSNRCPCCARPHDSGATVIVTPPAISNQWEREIQRHARRPDGTPLRVVVYEGIKRLTATNSVKTGSQAVRLMHPKRLASADIVLMTFDALMYDLTHTDENRFVPLGDGDVRSGGLRKRKRYRVVPSPLLNVKWWRVCLDEAQRVETPTAGSAQMALKLDAAHRWCISGTPVGKGRLEDLYGLLLFLRLDPFCDKLWFRKCLCPSVRNIDTRIAHLLSNVFWRSTKSLDLVREQMGVPEQIERKIMLQFSSIEKHFYERQLEQTLSAAGDITDSKGTLQRKRRKSSPLNILAEHLHRLRAACCHPQVGSRGIGAVKRSRASKRSTGEGDASVSSRVMTMSQILDKFIDDAKLQCEEAQRLAVLHSNGMAVISRLKVEAKQRGITIPESDRALLEKSCDHYLQSMRLADENAEPTLVLGEATLSGSVGFGSGGQTTNHCAFRMDWKWAGGPSMVREAWSKFDFTLGPARKITQLRLRVVRKVPDAVRRDASDLLDWFVIYPKECAIQCLSASGEFVNVHCFTVPPPGGNLDDEWILEDGFRTNKSKSWRLVVSSFHPCLNAGGDQSLESQSYSTFLGLDLECFEATIASDPLQRLHGLHNAGVSFSALEQLQDKKTESEPIEPKFSSHDIRTRIDSMSAEAEKIETLYLDAARAIHSDYHQRLQEISITRQEHESALFELTRSTNRRESSLVDCWDDMWWDDFLVICRLYGSEAQQQTLCQRLFQDLEGVLQGGLNGSTVQSADRTGNIPFPMFGDIMGLTTALQLRIRDIRSGLGNKPSYRSLQTHRLSSEATEESRTKQNGLLTPREGRFHCPRGAHRRCMQTILELSQNPTEGEIFENSHCKICKADWFQAGPKCRHCKVGEELEDLTPDRVTMLVLNSLYSLLKGNFGAALLKSAKATAFVDRRAKKFFDLLEVAKKERKAAWRMWRTHLDYLNDMDELNQCKRGMRLTFEDEDVTQLTEEEQNAVVTPFDVNSKFLDHEAKQVMALGTLRRAKGTLQFLKNQSAAEEEEATDSNSNKKDETCVVCLSKFDGDRAVLRCGHSFHLSPCLERLQSRTGNGLIGCPMRCRIRTDPKHVMIASNKARNDGSHSKRSIKGSYGTKVTRLVSDVLDVRDSGDKSLVFSQWDDMLDICEQALAENGVQFVRVTSLRLIGECTQRFRSPECAVMLLNVKNGAEGLTLLEATHVFMVEPLLNCGLDTQAINRIHRIGQNRKTYVWRYLVEGSVEMKIDKLRTEHQEDQLEDSIAQGKKKAIQGGGVDGGFASSEELLSILQP